MGRIARIGCLGLLGSLIAASTLAQEARPAEGPGGGTLPALFSAEGKSVAFPGGRSLSSPEPRTRQFLWTGPLVGPAPGGSFDPLVSSYGIDLAPVDDALRSQLELPKGEGVVVVSVQVGGLAEQAGLKPNDVLIGLGGDAIRGVEEARKILLGLGKETIEVKLIREGKQGRMSLVGPGHGFPAESSEFWIGVPVSPVDPTLRSHLGELPAEVGLVVNDVVKDSPADRSGVRKNDIVVSIGGQPLATSDALIAAIQATGGKPAPMVLLRGGKSRTVEIIPSRRAHPTVIQLGKRPGSPYRRVQGVWPNFAIESDTPAGKAPTETQLRRWNLQGWDLVTGPAGPPTRYDSILVNPHRVDGATLGGGPPAAPVPDVFYVNPYGVDGLPLLGGVEVEVEVGTAPSYPNVRLEIPDATGRIEAQLRDLSTKLDEVKKAVEGLKKPDGK